MGHRKGKHKRSPQDLDRSTMEIPEDEQWRLINESGIIGKVSNITKNDDDDSEATPLAEEIFSAVLLIIPFSFLLLMMEILIHYQYGKRPSFQTLVDRMAPGVPILSIFIFYTTRHKAHRRMQMLLFALSTVVGSRMIYLLNIGSWLVNMRQCPALATVWVYTIVQLDLGPAVLSLITVSCYVWWKELKMIL